MGIEILLIIFSRIISSHLLLGHETSHNFTNLNSYNNLPSPLVVTSSTDCCFRIWDARYILLSYIIMDNYSMEYYSTHLRFSQPNRSDQPLVSATLAHAEYVLCISSFSCSSFIPSRLLVVQDIIETNIYKYVGRLLQLVLD